MSSVVSAFCRLLLIAASTANKHTYKDGRTQQVDFRQSVAKLISTFSFQCFSCVQCLTLSLLL